ncbi:MAG TPA: exodeoxyribonuclease VII small subunit [Phnomibacter sp.]|nr:exodeoxyribonuclease VII small subunit [Phnomibacter sp.]
MSKQTFDDAWKKLEKLVAEIEDETLPLDVLAAKVKTAKQLIAACEDKLRDIEKSLQSEE